MIEERISVVFTDDAVYVDDILKRLPVTLIQQQLGHDDATAIHWHPDTQSGIIEYAKTDVEPFSDVSVITPYLDAWRLEPDQPDPLALGSYLDAITMGPQDEHVMALKAEWEEIKQRHAVRHVGAGKRPSASGTTRLENKSNAGDQSPKQRVLEQMLRDQTEQLDDASNPHKVREAERLRMLAAAKRKSA